jgi:outer membrane protein assembly factor BamB
MLVQGGKDATLRLLDREHLPGVGGELQRVELGDEVFSAPAVWRDQSGQTREGTSPVLEGEVVFVAMDGEIVALNARTGAKIWSSAGSGHSIGPMHWESPIVAGSRLYCSDENGRLTAFGL